VRDKLHSFDKIVGKAVATLPSWVRPLMLFATLIGQPPFTVGIATAVLGYGYALGKPHYEDAGVIALVTIIVSGLLKLVLRRHRPRNEYANHMFIKTFSFPSGHAAGALVGYGLAAAAVSHRWPEVALAAWVAVLVVIFFISLSRIYLGAHYASDIIGGWIIGGIGLLVIIDSLI